MEKDAHQITTRRTVQLTLGAPGARFGFPLERGSVSVRSIVEDNLQMCHLATRQGKSRPCRPIQQLDLAKRGAFIQSNSGVLPLQPHTSTRNFTHQFSVEIRALKSSLQVSLVDPSPPYRF